MTQRVYNICINWHEYCVYVNLIYYPDHYYNTMLKKESSFNKIEKIFYLNYYFSQCSNDRPLYSNKFLILSNKNYRDCILSCYFLSKTKFELFFITWNSAQSLLSLILSYEGSECFCLLLNLSFCAGILWEEVSSTLCSPLYIIKACEQTSYVHPLMHSFKNVKLSKIYVGE